MERNLQEARPMPIGLERTSQTSLDQRNMNNAPLRQTANLRPAFLLSVLFCLTLLGTACGPRATGGMTAEMVSAALADEEMSSAGIAAIDLPAIVIDYDTQGTPSVGGTPLTDIATQLGLNPNAAANLQLLPDFVTQLTKANIQHIQLDNAPDGLLILVNGEPVPSLVWDESSLIATAELMDLLGYGIQSLDAVLPLVRTAGIGVIIRFPAAADAELISTVVMGDESVSQSVSAVQEEFEATVGEAAQIQIQVSYAESGEWHVANMDATQWSQVIPAPWEDLNMSPALMAEIVDAGIEEFSFSTNREGLFVSVNGKTLPHIGWSQGELQHLLNLAAEPGVLDYVAGIDGESLAAMGPLIEQWLPIIQLANTKLTVDFP